MFYIAGPIPLRVREAEIPIVSDAECIRKVNAVTEKIFILPASSFCAGGEQGNDACQVYIDYFIIEREYSICKYLILYKIQLFLVQDFLRELFKGHVCKTQHFQKNRK